MTINPRIATAFESANGFPLESHLLVLGRMGSHSHGTYVAPTEPDAIDDVDFMGEKRKAMVRKYQNDVKNAAHLIRLLRMGTEFLRTGQLQVFRIADAEELRQINKGAWSLAQVKAEANRLFEGIEQARAESRLPAAPDVAAAGRLLIDLHREVLGV